MDSDSVRFEDVLTQLEEKRQRLEKAQAEADRLWRQREEDARKARTFREQMEKAKDNARTKGEAEAKRIVRQAQAAGRRNFRPTGPAAAASSKSRSTSRSLTTPRPPCGTV